jgi:hypothetical protein
VWESRRREEEKEKKKHRKINEANPPGPSYSYDEVEESSITLG